MSDEVKIPIVLEVEDTNKVTSTLEKLQKKASQINEMQKVRQSSMGKRTSDSKMFERSASAVRNYAKSIQDLSKVEGNDSAIKGRISAMNDEIAEINSIIGKYKELQDVLRTTNKASSSGKKKKSTWVNTDNAKELDQYIKALQGRMKKIGDLLETAPKGRDTVVDATTERMQREISVIDELIAKIGEYQQALANSKKYVQEQYDKVAEMRKNGTDKEALAEQEKIWKDAKKSYAELQRNSATATQSVKRDIKSRLEGLLQEERALGQVIQRLELLDKLYGSNKISSNTWRDSAKVGTVPDTEEEEKYLESIEQLSQAEKNLVHTNEQVAMSDKEVSKSSRDAASALYYKLRSVKMLGFVFNSAYAAVDRFGRKSIDVATKTAKAYAKLLPGVSLVSLAMRKMSKNQSNLSKNLRTHTKDVKDTSKAYKSATTEHDKFNFSLKSAIKTILAYGFGIRSLYMLMRRLRSAISSGFEEMAQQFDDVNQKMSSIVSSINYIKAALTAMVEPLLGVIAPALEKISELVANISYHVASFIASLTGQTAVYKAIRVQTDYAKSLDKTAEKAKKAKKELAGFDELNVLHSDDDDTSQYEKDYTMGWELVPIAEEAFDWFNKIRDLLKDLFEPIKNAWEKMKDFVINSFKFMVEKLKSLAKTIWDDFLKVWHEAATQKIFEDLFKILGDIFLIIGYIAEAIEEAWKYNDNGLRILRAIRDAIGIIVEGIRECADATVEWAKELDLKPLFSAIADVLEKQFVPALRKVKDLFVYIFKEAVLPLAKYLIEEFAPKIIRAFGDIVEAIGNIAERIKKALEENNRLKKIVEGIEKILDIIADGISECAKLTKEWSEQIDFGPLFEELAKLLNDKIAPALNKIKDLAVYLYDKVVLSMATYIIKTLGPTLLRIIGNISEMLGNIAENLRKTFDENKRGIRIVTQVQAIITRVVEAIERCTEKTAEWAKQLNLNPLVETFTQVLENQITPAIDKIVSLCEHLWNSVVLPMAQYIIETLGPKIVEGFGNIMETIGIISGKIQEASEKGDIGKSILEKVQEILTYIGDKFVELTEKTKEWAQELDLEPLMTSLNDNLGKIQPLIEWIVDTVGKFWTDVLLPFWTYIIEDGGPRLLDLLGSISDKINENGGYEALSERVDKLSAAFEKLLEKSWDTFLIILGDLRDKIFDLAESGKLDMIINAFVDWVDKADPAVLAEKIEKFAKAFAETYAVLALISKVILPVVTGFMTLANFFAQTGLVSSIKGLTAAMGGGASGGGLVASFGTAAPIILAVGAALIVLVGAFGGIQETIEEFKKRWDELVDSIKKWIDELEIKENIDDLNDSFKDFKVTFQEIRPVVEADLDAWQMKFDVVTKTIAGLIDGLCTSLRGLIDWIQGVIDICDGLAMILGGLVKTDFEEADRGLDKLSVGFGKTLAGNIETGNGVLEALGNTLTTMTATVFPETEETLTSMTENTARAIDGMADEVKAAYGYMADTATTDSERIADVTTNVTQHIIEGFDNMDNHVKTTITEHTLEETGSDYVKGFETGEISAFEDFKSQYDATLSELIADTENVINDSTLNPPGQDYITGLDEGVFSQFEPFTEKYSKTLNELLETNTDLFNSETLNAPGNDFIVGLDDGMESGWQEVNTNTSYNIGQLIATFKVHLNPEEMFDIGANLIIGLRDGLMSELEETLERVREICEEIKSTAEEAFEVASPSKVFARIGGYLMQGMAEGIDEDAEMPITSLNTALDTMMTSINTAFNSESSYLLGQTFVQGLELGINEEWLIFSENMAFTLTEFMTQLSTTFNIETLHMMGIELLQGLELGMTEYLPTLLENIAIMCTTINDAVKAGFGIFTDSEEVQSATGDSAEEAATTETNAYTEIGKKLMESIGIGLNEGYEGIVSSFDNIYKDFTTMIEEYAEKSLTVFETILNTVVDLTSTCFVNLHDLTKSNVALILNFLNGTLNTNTLYVVGQALIQGLMSGIASRNDELTNLIASETDLIYNMFSLGEASDVNSEDYANYARNMEAQQDKYLYEYDKLMDEYSDAVKAINHKYAAKNGEGQAVFGENILGGWYKVGKSQESEAKAAINEMTSRFSELTSELQSKYSDVVDISTGKLTAGSSAVKGLNEKTLYETGQKVIQGLIEGMKSKEADLFAYINDLCSRIQEAFNAALEIHSPSRMTQTMGELLMLGLQKGIDDNKTDVENDFSDIDLALDNKMGNKFLDNLTLMKDGAIDIISEMSTSIETIMANMDVISSIQEMHSSLNKLGDISVPNIAVGKILPSAAEFTQKQSDMIDYKQMASAVKDAMIESLSDIRYNNTDNQDIVLNIDGYELFRAVRNQSDQFRYSTGYGAL